MKLVPLDDREKQLESLRGTAAILCRPVEIAEPEKAA